jgi:uncharacterized membrane protein YgaE (UPF0421/DUF939 family)
MSNYIIELVIGCVVALISYFLKRTMDQLDKVTSKTYQTANELQMLERTFELKHDNLGKQMEKLTESLNKLTDKIDLLNDTVHELKYK